MRGDGLMRYRREVQVVFQDPYSSLSPRMRVGDIIAEPLEIHTELCRARNGASGSPRCWSWSGLQPEVARLFPHEFSGGQRQRIAIARALVDQHAADRARRAGLGARRVDPRADHEPARATCRQTLGVSYLFIGHDLATVAHISHRIAVMYLGQIVELADAHRTVRQAAASLYPGAVHRGIAGASRRASHERLTITGEVPSALTPPSGCRFHPRCPHAMARCAVEAPLRKEVAPGHSVACHLY